MKREFTPADLPKDGSEINLITAALGSWPEMKLTAKYNKDNFWFDLFAGSAKESVPLVEKVLLNNLNNGTYTLA